MRIAITSGKGGTGKTFVATNLFNAAILSGIEALLVDCDVEEPNAFLFFEGSSEKKEIVKQYVPYIDSAKCTFCGKCFDFCNFHAIVFIKEDKLIQVIPSLCHHCGACSYACDINAIIERKEDIGTIKYYYDKKMLLCVEGILKVGVPSPVQLINETIKKSDQAAFAILDGPPGLSCPFIATVDDADYVIVVAEPTLFGLNDLKLSIEVLNRMQKHFGVIINKSDIGSTEMKHFLMLNSIPIIMEIPFDREIAELYSEGKLLSKDSVLFKKGFVGLLNKFNSSSFSKNLLTTKKYE